MPFGEATLSSEIPSARKGFDQGTHRAIDPADTVARVRPFAEVMGITRIANVTGLDTIGVPVVMVCRPNSRSVSVSQGKGATLDAARASGLMESVESYHAERIVAPLVLGSVEELRYGRDLVDVNELPTLRKDALSPYEQHLWIEGRELMDGRSKWVPYELVSLNYAHPPQPGTGTFASSSNGLASGNHILEAVSHGICEVVERHATSQWRTLDAAAQAETCVDLDTVDDPLCRQILDAFERAGLMVAAWDMTGDIRIPSFLCRIIQGRDGDARSLRPASGMGCHPSRDVALLRALTEAAQSRLTFISGARDDMPREEYGFFLRSDVEAAWRSSMESIEPVRDFRTAPTWLAETFEEDVRWELARLKDQGITEVVAIDLTKPEFGFPVVKIVIPTLDDTVSSRRQSEDGQMAGLTEERP